MFEHGIDFLFNETSLYTKEKFKVFEIKDNKYEYDKDEFFRFLFYIGVCQDKLITQCHKCKKQFPFSIEKQFFEFQKYHLSFPNIFQFLLCRNLLFLHLYYLNMIPYNLYL